MTAIRTLIVDDEPLARRGLELRLSRHADIEIVGQAGNGREALQAIPTLRPQLMLLDVQMPGIDGLQLLRQLPVSQMPLTIFVTAYDRHAIAAFEANALDYLLKPVEDHRLDGALQRARERIAASRKEAHHARLLGLIASLPAAQQRQWQAVIDGDDIGADRTLTFRDGHRLLRIAVDAIRWIDAAGDYMCIHTDTANHIVRGTMREFEHRLAAWNFVRIHRSTIVHPRWIRELRPHVNGEYFVILDSGHALKLSRGYRAQLRKLM